MGHCVGCKTALWLLLRGKKRPMCFAPFVSADIALQRFGQFGAQKHDARVAALGLIGV